MYIYSYFICLQRLAEAFGVSKDDIDLREDSELLSRPLYPTDLILWGLGKLFYYSNFIYIIFYNFYYRLQWAASN